MFEIKRLILVLFLIFCVFPIVFSQARDRTTDRKLEIYTNNAGNIIYVNNEYDVTVSIVYKYSVSAVSKKDGKLIATNVFTAYDCVNPKSNKVLKKYDDHLHCYFQITNLHIEEYYEVKKCE